MDSLVEFISAPTFWVAIVLLFVLKKGVHFVPQNRGYVIYRMGKYTRTLSSGLNWIIPFFDSIAADRNLKEQTLLVPHQSAITKDNVALMIDGVLFIKVIDAAAATNNITDYKLATTQLAMTSMRNAIGTMELDECFQNRAAINAEIQKAMLEATQPWGIIVLRFELLEITIPASIKEDMERQMSAERQKRSAILTAEGEKAAAIAKAEGHKAAIVLEAEAAREQQVLAAKASKESQILEAEGKAAAITLVATAEAGALKTVGEAAATADGRIAVNFSLAQGAIDAHKAIAKESTVVLSDGKTGDNIGNTVAQALAVSSTINLR
ncbi:MAG: paraslipin [Gammaproteobacteria bacterium]|nr:MAG: paraslipin [Gammaproteobacteria bacterium]